MKLTDKILKEALLKEASDLEYIGNIKPEDFKIIGFVYNAPVGVDDNGGMDYEMEVDMVEDIDERLLSSIIQSVEQRSCRCNHCNARIQYVYIARSVVDDSVHTFGSTCGADVEKLKGFSIVDAKADNMRARKKLKKQMAMRKVLQDNPGLEDALKVNNRIVAEMNAKFKEYGSLSDKQIAAIFRLAEQQKKWDEEKLAKQKKYEQDQLEREGKLANAPDVPEGRMKGQDLKVVGVKELVEQGFGYRGSNVYRYGLLLEHESGWRIYGKVDQSKFDDKPTSGQTINITCTVTRNAKDPKFGFFQRAIINSIK